MELSGKIQSFDMDYFGRQELICDIEGNYRIHLYHDKTRGSDVFDLYNGLNHGPIFTRCFYGQKYEFIHLLSGRVKVRFYVLHDETSYHLHEMILPHNIGQKVTIKDLTRKEN
jgi:hypothetical protein